MKGWYVEMNKWKFSITASVMLAAVSAFAGDILDLIVPAPQKIVRFGGEVAVGPEAEVVYGKIPGAPDAVADQAYILSIDDGGCQITAGGETGARYARTTLKQIEALSGGKLPKCTITDWPALKWRGFMIDCGRNWLEMEGVKAIIDMMSAYKMNIFNWSLCNDWGWRLESKKYPQLNADSVFTRNIGKFYTHDDFREIVRYASERGITVVPEMDFPAHTTAFRKGMGVESMASPGIDSVVSELYEELCSLADEKTMPFIHIGTDEVYAQNVKVPLDWPSKWAKTVNGRGRNAVVWAPGMALDPSCRAVDMLWGRHNAKFLAESPHPFFDATRLYIEAWTPFDVVPRATFIKPCWQDVEESRKLGAMACAWQDACADESGMAQLGLCVVFPSIVALGDNFWHGRDKDDIKSASLMPCPGTAAFDEASRLEQRIVAQRDIVLKDFAHPFPFIAQTAMRWRVRDCETGEILAKDVASGALWLKTDASMLWRKHSAIAPNAKGRVAVETWVKAPEDLTCGAWIDLVGVDMNYGRLRIPCFPKKGQWNRYNATVSVNGEELPPPEWKNPGVVEEPVIGRYYSPLMEQTLVDEMPVLREPYPVKLKKGWNHICIESAVSEGKPDISLVSFALFDGTAKHPREVPGLEWRSEDPNPQITAYSMLTHDGRRMVSRIEGTNTVYELVPTNQLPAGLPPVREWKLYGLVATHTDIGLHNSQYIQRHGTVKRIDEAARLIDADTRTDDDPAAYRYVMEGFWFWDNYHQDKGMDAAWRIVTNYIARGRMDVGVTCAGNHTHLFSGTEIERSTLTKKILSDKWGIGTKTFIMCDNPGISCSVIAPYVRAGIKYGLFLPNQWNPIPSTIWNKNLSIPGATYNPDAMGGGNRVEVSYDSPIPMVFRWCAPGSDESLLMWCSTMYTGGYSRLGIEGGNKSPDIPTVERKMPAYLSILESKYPYDVWVASLYNDDEWPTAAFADFASEWNAKWAWPQFRTVGRLDEPFEYLEKNFGDKIPTLTGEMTGGWLQHAASTPELLSDKLNADRMLETAERLGTFAGTIDRAAVDRAWWYLILNDEHSYGTSGYRGRRVFETWMQHRDWIERAAETASNELAKAVSKLGLATGTTGVPPVVNGQDARSPSVCCANGTAENRWYRVVVTNGVIYSIYDKELKRELIDGPANKFLYTRDNHKTWESDPETALGAKVKRRVYLSDDAKRIDIVDTFEHARDLFNSRRYYRYGYLAFPFAVPDGVFTAHLNGAVIRPYEDCHPMTTDAYCAVRDWCAVENGEFGVALMMRDSTLTEFGEIHPDKTCYTGKPPAGKTAIYPYLFTDWLQMHQPDGDSMNFTFRFSITSYAGCWKNADVPRVCEDWLNPYAKWMRAHNVPHIKRETVAEMPPEWTGLLEKPRAGHGERDGQMYLLWGAEMSQDFDHYELYRDGKFLASVTNEAPDGIPYRVARYVDRGLPAHSRHEYRLRKVWKDGRKDDLCEPFCGLTRYVSDEERNGVVCEGEYGRMCVRYDGATVTSWKPEVLKGKDAFFMPKNTPWGKEVHGGLPVCWPWFGKREGFPKHGIARYLKWRLVRRIGKNGVELEAKSSPETMKIWPHPFKLHALISVDGPDSLKLKITETNTGKDPYESAFGVHPYFAVSDACDVAIDGERLPKPCVIKEFASDGKAHDLQDCAGKVAYSVTASGNDTWYAWNPGVERTPLCETLEPDEWRRFYCLEPFMNKACSLAPGESREHVVRIKVENRK